MVWRGGSAFCIVVWASVFGVVFTSRLGGSQPQSQHARGCLRGRCLRAPRRSWATSTSCPRGCRGVLARGQSGGVGRPAVSGLATERGDVVGDVVTRSRPHYWVTGASSGLGRALALEIAQNNPEALLILSATNQKQLEVTRDLCKESVLVSGLGLLSIELVPFDLSIPEQVQRAATNVLESYGGVDTIILCGGVSSRGSVVDSTPQMQQKVMQINYLSSVALVLALLPNMLKRGSGTIVSISSVQGKLALPFRSAYSASKHAAMAFFDSLRAEVSGSGLRVVSVLPGYIRTNLSSNAITSTGTRYNMTDKLTSSGMLPHQVARKILKKMESEDEIIIAPLHVRLTIGLRNLLPRVYFWAMAKRAAKAAAAHTRS